ncbi:MAG: HAMP domain-containing histidine kinase [Flavobacteriales bacterium]|nr:HAMP domain-containing histidine kinase [Flavobacteriales bacterium]
MNIYSKKQRWKFVLAVFAAIIVFVSLWYTNILVGQIAIEEKNKAKSWAEAIQRKAELVSYTQDFFEKIKEEETKKVNIWALATQEAGKQGLDDDATLVVEILKSNKTIPVILTDDVGRIIRTANIDSEQKKDSLYLRQKLRNMKATNPPIKINYSAEKGHIIYYGESIVFSELRDVLKDQIESFNDDIISNSASAPVVYTDSVGKLLAFGNLDSTKMKSPEYVKEVVSEMIATNEAIEVNLRDQKHGYIYYNDSPLLVKLKYYPFIQLSVIGLFLIFAYYLFSTARKSEQNQVWVGMAKETAHQLGTPLSSLLAWIEVLKIKNVDDQTISEISRDIGRLETVTERFSKIGAKPKLDQNDINEVIRNTINYLKTRLSKKVNFSQTTSNGDVVMASVNVPLLEWVLENIIKNGVDAIGGEGDIKIHIIDQSQFVYIDITDNGKGIPKGRRKTVFQPGFTTKQRGWGLGLSLTKRIIENYHSGKVFVKSSEVDQGTTFRIVLNKTMQNGRNIHSYSFL